MREMIERAVERGILSREMADEFLRALADDPDGHKLDLIKQWLSR